jgi:hypothetical protein
VPLTIVTNLPDAVVPTDIEVLNANANAKATKFIRDGVLYIERNGKTYNAQGKLVD